MGTFCSFGFCRWLCLEPLHVSVKSIRFGIAQNINQLLNLIFQFAWIRFLCACFQSVRSVNLWILNENLKKNRTKYTFRSEGNIYLKLYLWQNVHIICCIYTPKASFCSTKKIKIINKMHRCTDTQWVWSCCRIIVCLARAIPDVFVLVLLLRCDFHLLQFFVIVSNNCNAIDLYVPFVKLLLLCNFAHTHVVRERSIIQWKKSSIFSLENLYIIRWYKPFFSPNNSKKKIRNPFSKPKVL